VALGKIAEDLADGGRAKKVTRLGRADVTKTVFSKRRLFSRGDARTILEVPLILDRPAPAKRSIYTLQSHFFFMDRAKIEA
jgi:hypothetical protein